LSTANPTNNKREIRILVTGGGTGGHVGPALAIIQKLRECAASPNAPFTPVFRYIGSAAGIEAKLAREAGLDFAAVETGKLRRSSRGPLGLITRDNLRDLFRIPVGIIQSVREVRRFRPDVVLGTGGYVSVPPVVAAGLLHIPVLTHEQTVTIGLANRIAGRFASRIALTFEGALSDLPPPLRKKAFVTGNPVREAVFQGNRAYAARRFKFSPDDDGLPCVYVTGGAQGSRILNRAVEAALPELLQETRILHQCGQQPTGSEQDYDRLLAAVSGLPLHLRLRYQVTRFVETDAIGDAYALADLIVSRSGAGTVTEACALGKPALFVPLVPTGGDEQTRNAQRSVDAGAAVILPQADCEGPRLLTEIHSLLSDHNRLETMGKAALTLARPHADDELADALLALVLPPLSP
jgi:UDP-N-acetylglucosamine--N-acetylmuramyl-(pentapeptide) pyrophosphoryl-undecaprenol N-acetylglucosamine transferase